MAAKRKGPKKKGAKKKGAKKKGAKKRAKKKAKKKSATKRAKKASASNQAGGRTTTPAGRRRQPDGEQEVLRRQLHALARDEDGWQADEELLELNLLYDELGRRLAQILVDTDDPPTRQVAAFLLESSLDPSAEIPDWLPEDLFDDAVPILESALEDPAVPDQRKFSVLEILRRVGMAPDAEEAQRSFSDYGGSMIESLQQIGTQMEDTAEEIDRLLFDSMLEAPADPDFDHVSAAAGFALPVMQANPPAGTTLAGAVLALALEWGAPKEEIVEALLDGGEEADPGRLRWMLEGLAASPGEDDLRRRLAVRREALVRGGVPLRPLRMAPFARALLTRVDGAGSRSLSVITRRDDGGADALVLLLNDQIGVKDAWTLWSAGAQIEESIREEGLAHAFVDADLARALVEDALATHVRIDSPFPARLSLFRHVYGAEPLRPKVREPNLGAYALELVVPDASLVEGSDALADEDAFEGLGFDSPAAFDFVDGLGQRSLRPQKTVTAFLDAVEGVERERVTHRLAANLEVEALAGRARRPASRRAARTWLALEQGVVPFAEIPYVRALARMSLLRIRSCLLRGYRSQEEANAAECPY